MQPQRKLKKVDFTTEFVLYLGCYVAADQLAFAPLKEVRWTVRVQGLVAYDAGGRPTFVPGSLTGPPPPGDPNYDPQPGEDLWPFVFPTDGPRSPAGDGDRYYPLEQKLPGMDYCAGEPSAGNPSIFSHADAGVIAAGAKTAYGRDVGGLRLWVRVKPGESSTGTVIPPAPAYLIRRALKMGHF